MKWSDFEPYVAPHVIGCPSPVIEHHVRDAAIEFMLETKCWVRVLDPEITGTTDQVDLFPESSLARIYDVHQVTVDGVPSQFSVSADFQTLTLTPMPEAGLDVVITVAQVLKDDAATFPDAFRHYARHIATGAVASIKRIPGQPFSSADTTDEMRFRAMIRNESARLARGLVASGTGRALPSFI